MSFPDFKVSTITKRMEQVLEPIPMQVIRDKEEKIEMHFKTFEGNIYIFKSFRYEEEDYIQYQCNIKEDLKTPDISHDPVDEKLNENQIKLLGGRRSGRSLAANLRVYDEIQAQIEKGNAVIVRKIPGRCKATGISYVKDEEVERFFFMGRGIPDEGYKKIDELNNLLEEKINEYCS